MSSSSKQVSSTVRNGYQALINRVRVLVKEGKTEAEVIEAARAQMARQHEICQLAYDKSDIQDKVKFDYYVESEYIGQTMSMELRNTLQKVL